MNVPVLHILATRWRRIFSFTTKLNLQLHFDPEGTEREQKGNTACGAASLLCCNAQQQLRHNTPRDAANMLNILHFILYFSSDPDLIKHNWLYFISVFSVKNNECLDNCTCLNSKLSVKTFMLSYLLIKSYKLITFLKNNLTFFYHHFFITGLRIFILRAEDFWFCYQPFWERVLY